MVYDVFDSAFKNVFNDKELFLPIRWDGMDFLNTLNNLYEHYIQLINQNQMINSCNNNAEFIETIRTITNGIIRAVKYYLNGLPSSAYMSFRSLMKNLSCNPLKVYQKSTYNYSGDDPLFLFRTIRVDDNKPYPRKRVFHPPYNLRSKITTNRYSIAGYPSLYLGTSLDLCCEEIKSVTNRDLVIASAFKLERSFAESNTNIEVIELGIKPQDFLNEDNRDKKERYIKYNVLNTKNVQQAYLLWYPLIAACSYIRVNKKDPFAAEYIVPQLLMQWIRREIDKENEFDDKMIGIRYFSCASVKASDMGFNYVFPTSGEAISEVMPYCYLLAKAFKLTKPVYVNEYNSISDCERYLRGLDTSDPSQFKSII